MTKDKTVTMSRELAENLLHCGVTSSFITPSMTTELRKAIKAKPESYPCWSCKAPVTMANRADADGNCPHCEAELDLEDWPLAAPIVEADGMGEAVAWMALNRDGFPEKCLKSDPEGFPVYRSQPAPVSVVLPERRVQPNGFTGKGWAELRGWNACLDKVKELNK